MTTRRGAGQTGRRSTATSHRATHYKTLILDVPSRIGDVASPTAIGETTQITGRTQLHPSWGQ